MCYRCSDYEYDPCPTQFPGCEGECDGFDCMDCGSNTLHINEYYMVTDEVWEAAHPKKRGMLCIGCLEDRLGRLLTKDDFTDAPVNSGNFFTQSARLLSRLTGTSEEQLQILIDGAAAALARQLQTKTD